jgi:hypothetical protein
LSRPFVEDLETPGLGLQLQKRDRVERQLRARRLDHRAAAGDGLQMVDGDGRSVLGAGDARRAEGKLHAVESLAQAGGHARAEFVHLDRAELQSHEQRREGRGRNQGAADRRPADHEHAAPQRARLQRAARNGAGVGGHATQRDRNFG